MEGIARYVVDLRRQPSLHVISQTGLAGRTAPPPPRHMLLRRTQSRPIQFTKVLFSYIMAEVETAPVVQARHVVYCGGEDPRGANHNSNSFENIALIRIVCTLPPEV
jgi:hypothetical protein